jgi:predicted TIM-barrel fold metal-dependent hydrolase
MILDVHTHLCALSRGGTTSERLLNSLGFRFMRWRLGINDDRNTWQDQLEQRFVDLVTGSGLDAAVVLAFDAVYDRDGNRDDANTHLYVENQYVAGLARQHRQILFGASVHPYRKDAVPELQRCIADGAVLMKWLPLTQNFDPSDRRCFPLYEIMAHYGLPLLSHTGGEKTLFELDKNVKSPAKLLPAIERGVTVIAAHCGTRSIWGEEDYLDTFCRMARDYKHFYGDTAALTLPMRSYAIRKLLDDERVRNKLVHGSDWPVMSLPPVWQTGVGPAIRTMRESNWMKRDIKIKRQLGFDEAYWHRAGKLLRMPEQHI